VVEEILVEKTRPVEEEVQTGLDTHWLAISRWDSDYFKINVQTEPVLMEIRVSCDKVITNFRGVKLFNGKKQFRRPLESIPCPSRA
jgi:hypothetical protein